MKPPDVEGVLVGALHVLAPASTVVPAERPLRFIRASRAGGGRRDVARSDPRVLVECFAESTRAAFDLAGDAYAVVDGLRHSLVGGVWIGSVDIDDPVPLDHPDFPKHRKYQFLASLRVALQGDD